MIDFKEKIISAIDKHQDTIIKHSELKKEHYELFKKMDAPTEGHLDFKNTPKDFFSNFDYKIYDETHNYNTSLDYSKYLPKYALGQKINILVLINGYFSSEHSKIVSEDLIALSLDKKIEEDYLDVAKYFLTYAERYENPLTVLNVVLALDGLFIKIPKNKKIEEPIFIISVITDQNEKYLFNQRLLIVAEENSQATILERKVSESGKDAILVQIKELHQAENSNIDYYNLSNSKSTITDNKKNNIINGNFSTLSGNAYSGEANSTVNLFSIVTNVDFCRSRNNIRLSGVNSEANLYALSFTKDTGIVDSRALVEHNSSYSRCNQLVKAIADGQSKFIYTGKVDIIKGMKKIESHQNIRAVQLSDEAETICEPQLEIYSDDVICTHGASIGNSDENLLFYLQSRGINEKESFALLLAAFAGEIYDKIKIPELREELIADFFETIKK